MKRRILWLKHASPVSSLSISRRLSKRSILCSGTADVISSAEMTARWDEQKLELTREYKRRHRDAVKQRRRRQPGVDAGETFD